MQIEEKPKAEKKESKEKQPRLKKPAKKAARIKKEKVPENLTSEVDEDEDKLMVE